MNMNKDKNDTYDKVMGKNTLFSDSALDEMQRTESYRIGFKVFRVSFFLHLILSFAMFAAGGITENPPLEIAGCVYFIFSMATYLVYGAMTSAKGIMAPEMVKANRSAWLIVIWAVLAVVWILNGIKEKDMFISVWWVLLCVYQASMCLFARRSERVLKKQLYETDDETDDESEEG